MGYPRENTIQTAAIGAAGAVAVVKLPNGSTGALPAGQTATINPIGGAQRWRIRRLIVSYSAAPAAGSTLTVTDGKFTWTVDTNAVGPFDFDNLDLQCAPGAEVTITLSAPGGAILARVNASVIAEG